MTAALLALGVFVAAWIGTALVRSYGERRLMDAPNARSLHDKPTPRGGGLAIVVTFLAGLGLSYALGQTAPPLFWSLLLGGGLVAAIGFWDDHKPLPARVRLVAQTVSALLAVGLIGGIPHLQVGSVVFPLDVGGSILAVLGLVWLLNLYNFMDGIDGIAASEAVFASVAAAILGWMFAPTATSSLPLLAAAGAGFLLWNWPPARIFMGDVGSGFLGFVLGVYALDAARLSPAWVWAWLILLAPFIMDATVTLARRVLRGQRWHEAHRSHAYQRLAKASSHRKVTVGINLLNAFVMFPAAVAALAMPDLSFAIFLLTFAGLGAAAWVLGAGLPER